MKAIRVIVALAILSSSALANAGKQNTTVGSVIPACTTTPKFTKTNEVNERRLLADIALGKPKKGEGNEGAAAAQ